MSTIFLPSLKKKIFDYEGKDEVINSLEDRYRINYFYVMVDNIISGIEDRFAPLKKYRDDFGFLFNVEKLKTLSKMELKKCCNDLSSVLKVEDDSDPDNVVCDSDIDPTDFFEEMQVFVPTVPESVNDIKELLTYVIQNNLEDIYPNLFIVLRIALTIPVCSASAERSFSKLKLIKSHLRTTMLQERLTSLAMLSIESTLAADIDYRKVIEDFSKQKSRKILL